MSMLWVPLTVAAAFCQNLRSALQKSLKDRLGTTGATFVRFVYALPVAALYFTGLVLGTDLAVPDPSPSFALFVGLGGLAQIVATGMLVSLFDRRSFAVGTTYSKTETVQAAIFAIVVLGESVSRAAALGIAVSLVGVLTLSTARQPGGAQSLQSRWGGKPALVGLGSGAAFGVAAVSYRGASLSLGGEGFVMQAALTLLCVLAFQTLLMAIYMAWRMPKELRSCMTAWRPAMWVGLAGALASAGWFRAMTLQNAALVRALGQVELIFTLAASVIFFHERILRAELVGIVLVTVGILILLLG